MLHGCSPSYLLPLASHLSPVTSHLSPSNLRELGSSYELGADRPVVLVRTTGLCIGPGKAATHCGIERLSVDGTEIVFQENASPRLDACSPFPPAGAVDRAATVGVRDGYRLLLTEGDAVGAAGRVMRTREAWQRWQIAHAQSYSGRASDTIMVTISCAAAWNGTIRPPSPSRMSCSPSSSARARLALLTGWLKCHSPAVGFPVAL
jgi:hypothetical protein